MICVAAASAAATEYANLVACYVNLRYWPVQPWLKNLESRILNVERRVQNLSLFYECALLNVKRFQPQLTSLLHSSVTELFCQAKPLRPIYSTCLEKKNTYNPAYIRDFKEIMGALCIFGPCLNDTTTVAAAFCSGSCSSTESLYIVGIGE